MAQDTEEVDEKEVDELVRIIEEQGQVRAWIDESESDFIGAPLVAKLARKKLIAKWGQW